MERVKGAQLAEWLLLLETRISGAQEEQLVAL